MTVRLKYVPFCLHVPGDHLRPELATGLAVRALSTDINHNAYGPTR